MEKSFTTAAITIIKPQSTVSTCSPGGNRFLSSRTKYRLDRAMSAASNGLPTPSFGENGEIRVVSIREYKEAALSLAEAFETDDVARYIIDVPDLEHLTMDEKWDLHVEVFEYIVYAHCLKGLVTTTGPGYAAVALWLPPGRGIEDWSTMLRSGLWRLRYRLSPEGRKRYFSEFMPLLHDTMHATLGDRDVESWYLVYVGTRPTGRGKGYARKLINQITSLCDEEGRAIYLESSNATNPAIYRKMGFEERRRVHLQRAVANVELDIMVREPLPLATVKLLKP